ncbi:MAG: hypothetical protein WED33_04115 [Bacteroidia bacterium]
MKSALSFLLFLSFLISCSKEEYPRVEYKVNSSGSAAIAYTMVTPSIRTENVSGSWNVSFKHSQGASVFLSAINTGFGTTSISVYVNKELLYTQSTSVLGGQIEISEVIP